MSGALVQDVNYTIREASANVPNPFCGFGTGVQTDCTKYQPLLLNDGGDNGQNIPLLPHLQPDRKMDVVIAIDQSDDASDGYGTCCGYNWPQAYSLNWTRWYAEQPRGRGQGIAVPKSLPTPQQVSDKLSLVYTPTFFGCDPRDSTNPSAVPPLIVYLPNAPYGAYSNGTTSSTPGWEWGRLSAQHITNGLALASTGIPPGQAPDDTPAWPVCLACALADRARLRMKSKPGRSDQCIACFTAYCDDTKLDVPGLKDPISGYYSPPPIPNRFGTASPTDASYCYVYPEGYTTDCGNKTRCACNIPNACSDYNEYCSSSDVDEEVDEVEADRLKIGFGKDEL